MTSLGNGAGARYECKLLRTRCPIRRRFAAFKQTLWIVIAINGAMFIVEMAAGAFAGSKALQADALDFLDDTPLTPSASTSSAWPCTSTRTALIKGLSLAAMGHGYLVQPLIARPRRAVRNSHGQCRGVALDQNLGGDCRNDSKKALTHETHESSGNHLALLPAARSSQRQRRSRSARRRLRLLPLVDESSRRKRVCADGREHVRWVAGSLQKPTTACRSAWSPATPRSLMAT